MNSIEPKLKVQVSVTKTPWEVCSRSRLTALRIEAENIRCVGMVLCQRPRGKCAVSIKASSLESGTRKCSLCRNGTTLQRKKKKDLLSFEHDWSSLFKKQETSLILERMTSMLCIKHNVKPIVVLVFVTSCQNLLFSRRE